MTERLPIGGAALVGMALSQTLMAILRGKGILTAEESDEILDGVLTGLEDKFSPTDPNVQEARQIVELIFGVTHRHG